MHTIADLYEHFDSLRTLPGGWDLAGMDVPTKPPQPGSTGLYEAHQQGAKFSEPRTIPAGWDLSELT